jgi:hypothetical protein
MTDKPLPDDDQLPEAEADARFNQAIKNALATPPRPHKPKQGKESKAPKSVS